MWLKISCSLASGLVLILLVKYPGASAFKDVTLSFIMLSKYLSAQYELI